MSRIRIKNFGPIKEGLLDNDGWIEVKKATVFIGNQGSGKSAVAKLISTFTWIEKALVRGDYDKKWFERKNKLQNQYLRYHRLENYLLDNKTEIEYRGDAYSIRYADGSLNIEEISGSSYSLPQIMYVPAERNFIAYVKTARELKLSSDSLKEFLTEFENAKDAMKGHVKLPINNSDIEYDKLNDTLNLRGDGYKTKLTDASSGFQSLVPLFLVSDYLAVSVKKQSDDNKEPMSSDELQRFKKGIVDIWANASLTDEQRRIALSALSSKFNKTAFVNIVEEPEQNLFPSSQWQTLQCLLEFNNMSDGNKLIMTTHSPYIINFLSIAIQADYLKDKIIEAGKQSELLPQLEKVISGKSLISSASVIVYQLNELDGTIKKLSAAEGIPTDKNYLNDMLREGNNLFDTLLEIEEEI
ncbi:AAA family ATPase [Chitinophaga ginsengisoli]|uniref:Putative ATPase n=1 Tax=Chitinophaga ginsengisoli TaxID=363837 RepID=A0A2P8GM95_9BACT|nr:AAA family ATPase [Chitinophaga ginsengisoli]PSL35079.1 putative ATPase [Chitinophaga ginsengisoli]